VANPRDPDGPDVPRLLRDVIIGLADELRATVTAPRPVVRPPDPSDPVPKPEPRPTSNTAPNATPNEVRAQLVRVLHALNGAYDANLPFGTQTTDALEVVYRIRREHQELLTKLTRAENESAREVATLRRRLTELTRERDQARHDRNHTDETLLRVQQKLDDVYNEPDPMPKLAEAFAQPRRFVRADETHGTSGGVPLTDEKIRELADEAERGYNVVLLPNDWSTVLDNLIQELDVKPINWRDDLHEQLCGVIDDWAHATARRTHRDAGLARSIAEEESTDAGFDADE
jgi:hypothetical protein